MQQTEDQKPTVAPHMKSQCRAPFLLHLVCEQDHTRSEKQRKEAHELLIGEKL